MMNYNPYLNYGAQPQNYQGNFIPNQSQMYPNSVPNQTQASQCGFIGVQNEQEARLYPVGPGNSITFRDESAPYIYTKTMGNSPLDRPTFEKFRLVREEESASKTEQTKEKIDLSGYALKTDLSKYALTEDIRAIRDEIEKAMSEIALLKEKPKKKVLREVEVDDD